MSAKLVRKLEDVCEGVRETVGRDIDGRGMYARGLSTEGWDGGYQQALRDVIAHLGGYSNVGSRYRSLWDAPTKRKARSMNR